MAKFRNVSDDTRVLQDGRSVAPDAVVDIPDELVPGFECQKRLWRLEVPARKSKSSKDEV